ncbi:MAG: glucose-6-phosphate dehydrogenase [Pseudomonadota bacterium]
MATRENQAEPCDYVVFGATGDLAERKLLPALYHHQLDGQIVDGSRVIGASRKPMSDQEFRAFAKAALKEHVGSSYDEPEADTFIARLHYISVDARSDDGWSDLKSALGEDEDRIRAFYLAVGPGIFADIANRLSAHGLVTPSSRIVVEKPLGRDLASAKALNDAIGEVFDECQIFRIDHYLGKETVQNLMALRFANMLYEPLWNSASIDHVQITVAETVGLEGRAGYYDKAGALRDMVQNHLLQLLCLVAMEPPSSMDADAVRDEKLKVLRALQPITAENVERHTVRGQYKAGASGGGPAKAYAEELGRESDTETFVAIKAQIANWRWSGVPFYMRTGKRLPERVSEIAIVFKPVPHSIFSSASGRMSSNTLVIRLQPDEGMKQLLMIKDPGASGMRLRQIPLDMTYSESFGGRSADAYERLLLDVVRGNQTLFMRRDEVEAAWQWVDPIMNCWAETQQSVSRYTAGTWGPSSAIALIERDGRTWHEGA